ncbi:MAG: uroporphyrinogen decarboxylase [Bacteroidota bacterium]
MVDRYDNYTMEQSLLKNDLLLRTIRGEKTERTPVWLMRQAGRILPEYRAVRAKLSGFVELVKTPERAAEVTIQPVDILGVDAAIIFSDILVIPEAMGLPYEMVESRGPVFPRTVSSQADIARLKVADISDDLAYTSEAIKIVKKELDGRVPLIGFVGAPWTIFAYMVEGSGSKTFSKARAMLYRQPELSRQLLEMITESTIRYLKAQIAAGADVVQIFDSWAGILPPVHFEQFSLPYIQKICDSIDQVPITVFAKGAYASLAQVGKLNCATVGIDWNTEISHAREVIPNKVLQGNLDPAALYAGLDQIKQATQQMLDAFGSRHHIANLGHGVYPDISPDHVRCFIDTVKGYNASKRG